MSDKTTYVYNYDEPRIQRLEVALEQNTKVLSDMSKELAAERARADTLAQALEDARVHVVMACANTSGIESMTFKHMLDKYPGSKPRIIELIDAALSDWRTARGAK